MSDEQHLDEWVRIETTLQKEVPGMASYALVAVMDSGALHWGADHPKHLERLIQGLSVTLGALRADVEHQKKMEKKRAARSAPSPSQGEGPSPPSEAPTP